MKNSTFALAFVVSGIATFWVIDIKQSGSPALIGEGKIVGSGSLSAGLNLNPVQAIENARLQTVANGVVEADIRNSGIDVSTYFRDSFNQSTLVFNLTGVSASKSRLDVFRVLLDFSKALEEKQFEQVILASNGNHKFTIDGTYFQQLGQERDWQNPTFTIRTFPEHLRTLSGDRAYAAWTGGLLGVVTQQMDDFNDFHSQWYLNDMVAR